MSHWGWYSRKGLQGTLGGEKPYLTTEVATQGLVRHPEWCWCVNTGEKCTRESPARYHLAATKKSAPTWFLRTWRLSAHSVWSTAQAPPMVPWCSRLWYSCPQSPPPLVTCLMQITAISGRMARPQLGCKGCDLGLPHALLCSCLFSQLPCCELPYREAHVAKN